MNDLDLLQEQWETEIERVKTENILHIIFGITFELEDLIIKNNNTKEMKIFKDIQLKYQKEILGLQRKYSKLIENCNKKINFPLEMTIKNTKKYEFMTTKV
jgi:hypothetical protein